MPQSYAVDVQQGGLALSNMLDVLGSKETRKKYSYELNLVLSELGTAGESISFFGCAICLQSLFPGRMYHVRSVVVDIAIMAHQRYLIKDS